MNHYIDYQKRNTDNARILRKNMTLSERRVRFKILKERPCGYKRIRQKMIDNYIVDFYCARLKIAIEIDGDSHYSAEAEIYDKRRSEQLQKVGVKVIRFTNKDVEYNIDGVFETIITYLEESHLANRK